MIRFGCIRIDRANRTIHVGNKKRCFKSGRRGGRYRYRLYEALLLGGGMTAKQLFATIYGDHEDGGPLVGQHIIPILLNQERYRLAQLGLVVQRDKSGPWQRYRLAEGK